MTTREKLQALCDQVNVYRPHSHWVHLQYEMEYGYCLEDERGAFRYSPRMSYREMTAYLSGMIAAYDHMQRCVEVNP